MQPYQEATKEIGRQGELPLKLAKRAASVGSAVAGTGAAYLAGGAINRVLPFLSRYVPEDLAIKGLSKVDPRFGKFIQTALSAGESFDQAKEFIGSKIEEQQEKSDGPAKQSGNIIEQEDPKLFKFLDQEIRKGRKPIEAAAIAQNLVGYRNTIEKLVKAHKTPWSSIIESIFGKGDMALPSQQPGQQQQMGQPGQPPQGGQGGPGQQALMGILAKINQKLGQ